MKRSLLGLALVLSLQGVAYADDDCDGKTQLEINACHGQRRERADAEMNRVYPAALKRLEKDKKASDKLKAAQRAWLAFRDAEVAARFPTGASSENGSVYPMCTASALTELTEARTEQLRVWVDGVEAG